MNTERPPRTDRLAELVTHLSGAPLPSARVAVNDATQRNGVWGDNLLQVADALVTLRATA